MRSYRSSVSKLVNPGTVTGIGAAPTCVLGDLAHMQFSARHLAELTR